MAERTLEPGETLISEGDAVVTLYELCSGTLEILRGTTTVAVLAEPGAVVGELSLLLDRAATASVRARSHAVIVEVDDARERLVTDPAFTAALARLLARRLDTMTGTSPIS